MSDVGRNGVQSAAGTLPLDQIPVWELFRPRFSIVHQGGQGVGFRQSFTSLETFIPIMADPDAGLTFADCHALFDGDGARGANIGLGKRTIMGAFDAVFGTHLYYDYIDLGINQFQRISPGLSLVRDDWELHANGYLARPFDERKVVPNRFAGTFLFVDRFETAMSGADCEIGVSLPVMERFRPKLFGGVYRFVAASRPDVTGWKARVESALSDRVSSALSVQDDPLFGTTVNATLSLRFSASSLLQRPTAAGLIRALSGPPSDVTRQQGLVAPVSRFSNVVVDQTEETLALDPMTGLPIVFCHVAPGGNSDGSFESPYATLNDALNDPRHVAGEVDIIYVRGSGTDFVAQTGNGTVADETALLSDGPIQTLSTQLGVQVLPLSGADTGLVDLPRIDGQIALGAGNTVSGFEFAPDAGAAGILGDAASNFTITSNVFDVPSNANGIILQNQTAGSPATAGLIANNRFTGPGEDSALSDTSFLGSGILVRNSTSFAGTIRNNESDELAGDSVVILDSQSSGDITDNSFSNGRSGIHIESGQFFNGFNEAKDDMGVPIASPTRDFVGDITSNRISANRKDGIAITSAFFDGNITDNDLDNNVQSGIHLTQSRFEGNVADNDITGANLGGAPEPAEVSRIFTIAGGKIAIDSAIPRDSGIRADDGIFAGSILRNTLTNFPFSGIRFVDGTIEGGEISDNILRDNQALAIDYAAVGASVAIRRNLVENNGGGIYIEGIAGTVIGQIEDNIIRNNVSNIGIANSTTNPAGNIVRNQISDGGILVLSLVGFGDIVVTDNTIDGNTGHGVAFASSFGATGGPESVTITDNTIRNIVPAPASSTASFNGAVAFEMEGGGGSDHPFTFTLTGNTIEDNQMAGVNVQSNTARNVSGGLFDPLQVFIGVIENNPSIRRNAGPGINLDILAGGDIRIVGNTVEGNNVGASATGPQVVVEFTSASFGKDMDLFLSGNTSTTTVTAPAFNYDLINNPGTGFFTGFNVTPFGVSAENVGTVGSSDGSVTIP